MVFAERCSESASELEEHWYATLRNPGRVRGDAILENGSDAGRDFQTLSNVGIALRVVGRYCANLRAKNL
ncbi:MAG TPA: hypothetical protein VGK64_04865 [Bryobacteraceae bacterium]